MKVSRNRKENLDIEQHAPELAFEDLVVSPSLRIWAIYCLIFLGILSAKLLFLRELDQFELLWRGMLLAGASYLGYIYLFHVTTCYRLNPLEVVGQSGVFSKKIIRLPLNRITNYECKASFIERILGISNVMLDTPGGAGYELAMYRLPDKDSARIVSNLRYLMGQQKIAEAGSNELLKTFRQKAVAS